MKKVAKLVRPLYQPARNTAPSSAPCTSRRVEKSWRRCREGPCDFQGTGTLVRIFWLSAHSHPDFLQTSRPCPCTHCPAPAALPHSIVGLEVHHGAEAERYVGTARILQRGGS